MFHDRKRGWEVHVGKWQHRTTPNTAREWSILNWNIRGLNDPKKWAAIHNKIEESQCSIICIQETKREAIDSSYLRNSCPKRLNKFEILPSVGASGGLLIAWNEQIFKGQLYHINEFSLTIHFTSSHNGEQWILSNVYGPCQHQDILNFINWVKDFQIQDNTNWLV